MSASAAVSVSETLMDSGLYILLLRLAGAVPIKAGRLPEAALEPGAYAYVGRARRNLRARLRRHFRHRKTLFWHIDFLLRRAEIDRAWVLTGRYDECDTAQALAALFPGARIPMAGFGSSDCRCRGHLVFLPSTEGLRAFLELQSACEVKPHDLQL